MEVINLLSNMTDAGFQGKLWVGIFNNKETLIHVVLAGLTQDALAVGYRGKKSQI